MKRGLRMLLCLALFMALIWTAAAFAEGDATPLAPELSASGSVIPIWEGADPDSYGFQPPWDMANANITNYSAMRELYGDTEEWSCTQTSGPEVGFSIFAPGEGNSWADLHLKRVPEEAGEAEFEFSVTWGGQTATKTVTVTFVEVEPPTDVSVPEVIDLQLNETQIFTGGFVPEDWTLPGHEDDEYWLYFDDDNFHTTNELTFTKLSENQTSITGNVPGRYRGTVQINKGRMVYFAPVTVLVREANGDLPVPRLAFRYDNDEKTVIIAPLDYDQEIHHDGYLFSQEISEEDYEALVDEHGPATWSLEQISGPTVPTRVQMQESNRDIYVHALSMPETDCDVVLRLTCTMGDLSASQDVTVHFVAQELPTGSTIPETITVKAGETVKVEATFITDNPFWSDPWFYCPMHNDERIAIISKDDCEDEELAVTGVKPGVLFTRLCVFQDNVYAYREVKIQVTDENGNVPDPELAFSDYSPTEKQIVIATMDSEQPIYNSGSLFYLQLDDDAFELYHAEYGDAEWQVTQISGPALSFAIKRYDEWGGFECDVTEMPAAPCNASFHVTCTMGPKTLSCDMTVHFVAKTVPTGCTIPDEITVKAGETVRVKAGFIPDDPFWAEPSFYWNSEFEFDKSVVAINQPGDQWDTLIFTGRKPGVTQVKLRLVANNMIAEKIVEIRVTEAGAPDTLTLPAGLKTIDEEAFAGIAATRIVVPAGCETIGARAFAGCANLSEIVIPASVTTIAGDAFGGKTDFTIVTSAGSAAAQFATANGIQLRTE